MIFIFISFFFKSLNDAICFIHTLYNIDQEMDLHIQTSQKRMKLKWKNKNSEEMVRNDFLSFFLVLPLMSIS